MMVKTARKDVKFDKRAAKYDDEFEGKISQKVYQLVMESVELNSGDKILDKTTPRLLQSHTLKNAVKPPFLVGFFISGVSAA